MAVYHVLEVPTIKVETIEKSGTDPIVLDSIQIPSGAGEGKVLQSNTSGVASWGDAGTSGSSGTSGEVGATGETGTSGSSGTSGDTGTSGSSGSSGSDGTSGTSGTSYATGESITFGDSAKITWDVVPSSNQTCTGNIASLQAGEELSYGQPCYLKSDGKWYKTDSSSSTTMPCLAIVASSSISQNDSGNFLINWSVARDDSWSWTVGGLIYVSEDTGLLTQTAPISDSSISQIVGFGLTATVMGIFNCPVTIENGLEGVDLADATPTTILFSGMSSLAKTWFLNGASDQTITFDAPSASDKYKRFTIMKTGTGAGKVIIDLPNGVYGYAEGQETTSGGTITLAASKRGCITLVVTSTTSLQVISSDGDITFA